MTTIYRAGRMPSGVICGPTTGCGKEIPFHRTEGTHFGIGGATIADGPLDLWQTPEHCPHCGKWCGVQSAVVSNAPTPPPAAFTMSDDNDSQGYTNGPSAEPTPTPAASVGGEGTNTHCDRSIEVVCALPAGHEGSCIGPIRRRDGTSTATPRRTPAPTREAASTQREEWVVQNGLHDEPGVWEDLSEWDYEEQARNALVANREHTDSDLFRWRLVHRRITETVIEGASEQ